MNLYHLKITDNQKDALERLFNMGIVWSKTELSEAWEQLREQLKDSVQCVAIINALQDSGCNCKKPIETAPKYDPNRQFREGDKVKPRERNGRIPWAKDMMLTVISDERNSGVTVRDEESGEERLMCVLFLELVTPVKERVSFRVGDFPVDGEWSVWKNSFGKTEIISSYKIATHPHAKEAAEAECARLNAEYRKEQK